MAMPASFRIRTPAIYVDGENGVMYPIHKIRLYWHVFQQIYHELLVDGCLCNELRQKYLSRISYHKEKVSLLKCRLNSRTNKIEC